jgi:hypothetical protein
MSTTDGANIPTSNRRNARITGAIIGIFLAAAGAILGGWVNWVNNALEGAIVCGAVGAVLGPIVSAFPTTGRKVIGIGLAAILACIGGAINLSRNSGLVGTPDVLIQAKLDPMTSSHVGTYRLCTQYQQTGGIWGLTNTITLNYDAGSADRHEAITTAAELAVTNGWIGHFDSDGNWEGVKPKFLALWTQSINIDIRWNPDIATPNIFAPCNLNIYISGY